MAFAANGQTGYEVCCTRSGTADVSVTLPTSIYETPIEHETRSSLWRQTKKAPAVPTEPDLGYVPNNH